MYHLYSSLIFGNVQLTFATEYPTSRHLTHGLASNKHRILLLVDTSLNPFIPNTVPQKRKLQENSNFFQENPKK